MIAYICTPCNYLSVYKFNYNPNCKYKNHQQCANTNEITFSDEELDIITTFLKMINGRKPINDPYNDNVISDQLIDHKKKQKLY